MKIKTRRTGAPFVEIAKMTTRLSIRHAPSVLAVILMLSASLHAEDWVMAYHDAAHTGASAELLNGPLTQSWTWTDTIAFDNGTGTGSPSGGYIWFPIYYRGKLYFTGGLNINKTFCLDPVTGKLVWYHSSNYDDNTTYGAFRSSGVYPAAAQGRILAGDTDNWLSIDAEYGIATSEFWNLWGGWPCGGIAIWNNKGYFQGSETDSNDERYFMEDQFINWNSNMSKGDMISGEDQTIHVPAVANGISYSNCNGLLRAFSAWSGEKLWTWGTQQSLRASPAVYGNMLYIASGNGTTLVALDMTNVVSGTVTQKWSINLGGAYAPITNNGIIYVGSSDKKFYALDAGTGAVKWSYLTGAGFTEYQIPALSGNNLFVPGADGTLYTLNATTGAMLSKNAVSSVALGPVVIGGGRVFTSDQNGKFYGFVPQSVSGVLPQVTGVTPIFGTNDKATTINITGSGFFDGGASSTVQKVWLDNAANTVLSGYTVTSDSQITGAVVPAGLATGTFHVLVQTTTGQSTPSTQSLFNVLAPGSSYVAAIGASGLSNSTAYSYQRHVVKTSDGTLIAVHQGPSLQGSTNLECNFSYDGGASWTGSTVLPIANGNGQAKAYTDSPLWIDANDILYLTYNDNSLKYKLATFQYVGKDYFFQSLSDNVINTTGSANGLCVEPSGRIWVADRELNSVTKYYDIYASYSDDGGTTWSASVALTSATSNGCSSPTLVLRNNLPVCIFYNDFNLAWASWNGISWSTTENLPGPIKGVVQEFSATATRDQNIHLVFNASGIKYTNYNGTAWSAAQLLDSAGSRPSLTTDSSGLVVFYTSGNNLVYKTANSSLIWSSLATSITTDANQNTWAATSAVSSQFAPVLWTAGTAAPYAIKATSVPLNSVPAPVVTSLSPNSLRSDQSLPITITGSGFYAGGASPAVLDIQLDDPMRTRLTGFSVASDTQITGAVVPKWVAAGTYNVMVTTLGGTNKTSQQLLQVQAPVYPNSVIATATNDFINTLYSTQRHLVQMSDGAYVIVYYDNGSAVYSISTNSGQNWSTPVVIGKVDTAGDASSVVFKDNGDILYMLMLDASTVKLKLYKFAYVGGTLSAVSGFPKATSLQTGGFNTGIQFVKDASGRLWVGASAGNNFYVYYSDNDGTSWSAGTSLTSFNSWPGHYSLTLVSGYPFAVYSSNSGGKWRQWNPTTQSWSAEAAANVAGDFTVAVTSDNYVHVVYSGTGNKGFSGTGDGVPTYSYFNGTAWSSPVLLDPVIQVGLYPALTTDGANLWCFYTDDNQNVVYRYADASGHWSSTATPITGDGGGNMAATTLANTPASSVPVIWTQTGPSQNTVKFSAVVPPTGGTPIIMTPSPLLGTDVGTAYSQTFVASGGAPPYTWSVTAGSLPVGLSLSSAGVLSGTPNASGTSNFTVQVTDNASKTGSKAFALTVNASPSITTTSPLTSGDVGTAYSQTFAVSGGTAPFTWSLSVGTLPPGLTLSSAGVLSGTPTTAGTSNFTIKVADVAGGSASKAFALTINAALSITTTSPLLAGDVGIAYSRTFAASGGTAPLTWTVSTGTLPAGLSLSSAGSLTGSPTTAGTSNFTIKVADAAGGSASKAFALTINTVPAITTASPLPTGTIGTSYSQTFAVSGGTTPFTWSATSGTLPAGLTLSSAGVLSGTPTTAGTSNFTIKVADAAGGSASKAFSLNINTSLTITTSSLPAGDVSVAYSKTLTVAGGTAPYTWSLSGGSLPAGLSLSAGGVISGAPTSAGTSSFTAAVTDSLGATATRALSITINAAPSITTSSPMPGGDVTVAYSKTLSASNGTPPYAWSISAGSLPTGLTLTSSGTISGTPTTAATSNFTVKLTDAADGSTSKAFALTINAAPAVATASPLPLGNGGVAYSQMLAASGGTTPFSWSVGAGTLPAGLSLSSTGLISGTSTAGGTSNFTVKLTDAAGGTASKAFALTINAPPSITSPATAMPNPALAGESISFTVAASDPNGGTLTYTWDFGDATSGSGASVPHIYPSPGTYTATVTVTDAFGAKASSSTAVTVNPAIHVSAITMMLNTSNGKRKAASATATIVDSNGATVSGATVDGSWSGLVSGSASGTTANDGTVTLTSSVTSKTGTFTFTVTSVTATGCTHDSAKDVVTWGSITTSGVVSSGSPAAPASSLSLDTSVAALSMTVSNLSGVAHFNGGGHDACALLGSLPNLPAGFIPAGQQVVLNVGGASTTFTLDSKGRGKSAQGVIALKPSNGTFAAKLQHGTWAAAWNFDPNTSTQNSPWEMSVTLEIGGNTYAATATTTYSAKAQVVAKFKK
jgi:hypothetical protein